jgi:DNA repair exonuclease SbcCD ATPase subunit
MGEVLNEKAKIEKIYHIGDVHVMKNSHRDQEYREVFENLYKKISEDTKNSLVVCTGDIFNDGLSPSSIILVKNLFSKLSELCDIVIFRGNHDQTSRSNSETMDFLFPVLYKLKAINKIHILNKTGSYIYGNIVFGYTDVYENSVYKIEGNNDKIKIGLWHGTINGSKIDNNSNELEGKFGKKDFEGYDYVMLGDIHKFQYLNKEKTIAYCGSTLQLNFGESITNHGFLKWDLKKKTSEHHHIKNNYGFLTVKVKNNIIEKYDKAIVPKNINLRIIYENSDSLLITQIHDEISKEFNVMSYHPEKKNKDIIYTKEKEDSKCVIDEKSSVQNLMDYIKKNENDADNNYEEIEKLLNEKIKEIDYKYNSEKRNIKLKSLCFNNFNVYGEDNCIDYTALKGIVNISGQNGIGKSSLIHCILYSIYGLCETAAGKYDYINSKKREMETLVVLEINGKEYKIFRECRFRDAKKTTGNIINNLILYENGKDISGKSLPEVSKQIHDIVGDPDDFKKLCVMEQKTNESFLNLKDNEKMDHIVETMKLDIYNTLSDIFSSEAKTNNKLINANDEKIYENPKQKTGRRDEILEKELEQMMKYSEKLNIKDDELNEEYQKINKEKIEKELKYNELKELGNGTQYENKKKELEKAIENNEKEMENLKNNIIENKKKMENNNKAIKEKKNIEEKNKIFEEKKKKDIEIINDEINFLFEGFVKIEKKIENIQKINEEKKKLENSNDDLGTKISLLEDDIAKLKKDIDKYTNKKGNEENYEKYIEMVDKINEIEEKIKILKSRLGELVLKKKKTEKEHKKSSEKKESLIEQKKENQFLIDAYGNIEDKKKKFDMEKDKKISILNDEIHTDLKKYIKVDNCESIEFDSLSNKLKKLAKEKNDYLDNLKYLNETIKKISDGIVKLEDEKNITEKYNDYLLMHEEMIKKNDELKTINNILTDLENHFEMMKSHEYNKNCEICMKNKMTQNLITTESNIKSQQKQKEKCEKEYKKIVKENTKYEIYKIQYDERINILKKNSEFEILLQSENNKKDSIEAKIKIVCMEIDKNKLLLDEYNKKQKIVENNKILDAKIKKNKQMLENLKNEDFSDYKIYLELSKKKCMLNGELDELAKSMLIYETISKEIDEINLALENLYKDIDIIRNQYKKYEKCGELYEENKQKTILLNKKINELEISKKNHQININNISTLSAKIDEYDNYLETEKNNKIILSKIDEKKKFLKNATLEKYDDYEKYQKIVEENKILENLLMQNKLNLKNIEILNENIKRELKDVLEILKNVQIFKEICLDIEKINKIYCSAKNNLDEFKKEKNSVISKISELSNELKNIKASIENNEKIKKEYDIRIKIADIIKDGFIDNLLTYSLIPDLCENVNNILSSFVNFQIHMEYDNKKIIVYKKDMDGILSNASKLSGYEALMANISFRLAINNKNNVQKTNFFIIDEGFAFCDEQSVPKISNLFLYMRSIYDFVIVVSHNEQIRMYTDMNLGISHKDGYSSVRFVGGKTKEKIAENLDLLNSNSFKKKGNKLLDAKVNYKEKNKKINEKEKTKKIIKKKITSKKKDICTDSELSSCSDTDSDIEEPPKKLKMSKKTK